MSPLFYLASDFIDRMSNPRWGSVENDEYAMRFGQLLDNEGFENTLQKEAPQISDVDNFTSYGWIWFLKWARSRRVQLNPELLFSLLDQWQSVMTMALIIELATFSENPDENGSVNFPKGNKMNWIDALVLKCILGQNQDNDVGKQTPGVPDIKYTQNVWLALIQAGNRLSLEAAGSLLRIKWSGQNELLRFFIYQLELLDEETQEVWIRTLRPPSLER